MPKQKLLPFVIITAVLFTAVIVIAIVLPGRGEEPSGVLASSLKSAVSLVSTAVAPSSEPESKPEEGFPVTLLSKRVYLLSYIFGVQSFEKAEDISPSVLTQYAFCHLFQPVPTDAKPEEGLVYRQAVESSIREEVARHFVISSFDPKKSELYNKQKRIFEMWQPDYSAEVHFTATAEEQQGDRWGMTVTFFTNRAKNIPEKKFFVIFQKQNDLYLLVSMKKL